MKNSELSMLWTVVLKTTMANNLDNAVFGCGHPEEWAFIAKTYGPAVDELMRAHSACLEFLSSARPEGQEQNVLYLLAASCLKEFEEICLLAGNGYGAGATKLLRPFYERVVTFSYLALKPDKVQQFIDYTDVHWRKMLDEAEKIHANANLAPEKVRAINENFEKSRDRFTEYVCKPCEKRRLQMSWTKAPVPEQATQVNEQLRMLCFNAYLRPTFYLHTTFYGVTMQAERTEEGRLRLFGTDLQREHAREALELAHVLMVQVIDVVNNFFKLDKGEHVAAVAKGWKESWSHRGTVTEPAGGDPSQSPQT